MIKICDYGCGKEALYKIGKKWCCSKSFNSCSSKKVRKIIPREKPEFCDYGCEQEPKYFFKKGNKWCCSKSQNSCPSKKERARLKRVGISNKSAQLIETDNLCSFGCNQKAKYIYQNGMYCCSYDWHKCSGKQEQISNTTSKTWSDLERRKRLSETQRKDLIAAAIPVLENDKVCKDCGNKANFWFKTNNRYSCSDRIEKCPVVRKQISNRLTKQWKDISFTKKIQESLNLRPNKPETLLINLFKDLNLNFEYTGDFSFMINGKNPDFTNYENKKVIEFFGTYWHSEKFEDKSNEQSRIKHFAKEGYKCLIIWEEELKEVEKIIEKVIQFAKEI